MTYIVIVQRTPLQRDVYGPYRSFKAADGDAKAWGGTVEPVMKPAAHDSSEGKQVDDETHRGPKARVEVDRTWVDDRAWCR